MPAQLEGLKQKSWPAVIVLFFLLVNFNAGTIHTLWLSRICYFSFFIALFFLLRRFSLHRILPPAVGGISLLLFGYGLLQKFLLFPIYLENIAAGGDVYVLALKARIQSGRIFSLFQLPTLYAIICVILLLAAFHYIIRSGSMSGRIFWGFAAASGLANLVFTQSFGGLVCLGAGVLIYLLLTGILKFKYLAPTLMTFMLIFSIFIGLRYSEARKLEPAKLRFSNWAQAWRVFTSAPVAGVGLGGYEAAVSDKTLGHEAKSIYAHNFFLQFIAETGVISLLLAAAALWTYWKRVIPPNVREGDNPLYLAIFVTLTIYNAIDIGFYFFAAALSAVAVLSQLYRRRETADFRKTTGFAVIVLLLAAFMGWEHIAEDRRTAGDVHMSQKDFMAAEQSYRKSIAMNPFNFKALYGCGQIAFMNRRLVEAQQYMNRVISLYPDHAAAHYLLARIALDEGRPATALRHAGRARRKAPLNNAYYQLYSSLKNYLENYLEKQK